MEDSNASIDQLNAPSSKKKSRFHPFWKVLAIVGLLIFGAFAGQIGKGVSNSAVESYNVKERQSAKEEIILDTAKKLNAQMPVMMDNETRAESVLALGMQLSFNYTMVNIKGEGLDIFDKLSFETDAEKLMITNMCSQDGIRKMLSDGVKYQFNYFAKDGVHLATTEMTSEKCK